MRLVKNVIFISLKLQNMILKVEEHDPFVDKPPHF